MELSAKITKSVYLHLESLGVVAGEYLELAGLSSEAALDAERWISLPQVEFFLDLVLKDNPNFQPRDAALKASENRGWGLLDQVLRIIQKSSEIYQEPKQFLSYFVRPDLNFEWTKRNQTFSSFNIALSTGEFPLIVDYLKGALEAVAKYTGGEPSTVVWVDNEVSIDWSKKQDSFFESAEPVNFKPEIYKEAVNIIQRQQMELLKYKSEAVVPMDVDAEKVAKDLKVLEDYFLRSRQLVALLKAESGQKKWFKEALKRLNWDELQGLHSQKVKDIKTNLSTPVHVGKVKGVQQKEHQFGLGL